jgi:ornithine cyclodeaminase/alanine dehydrogenase-like protein (mu-crystallin family)
MRYLGPQEVADGLPYGDLVESLRQIYQADGMTARRDLIDLTELTDTQGTCMAIMPAWGPGHDLTTKIFTLFPKNREKGLPTIHAIIFVFDASNGSLKAIVDGTEVTRRRTACMSALAADYLARQDSRQLLVCGAGALAPHAALAHASVRPIECIEVWARREQAAASVVEYLRSQRDDLELRVTTDLAAACRRADIVTSQTSSPNPIVFGEWITPGTHLDFVGSHDPNKRECDDEVARISKIYVDVIETAMREAGDILIPLHNGVITKAHILGDLSDLTRGIVSGRTSDEEITLFKSTGSSLADLAAAELAVKNMGPGSGNQE